jgi:hypothetical protein
VRAIYVLRRHVTETAGVLCTAYGTEGLSTMPWRLDGGEWSISCHAALQPGKEPLAPIGDLVVPWAGLDAVRKRKISYPYWELNSAIQPVAHHFTDWSILALLFTNNISYLFIYSSFDSVVSNQPT